MAHETPNIPPDDLIRKICAALGPHLIKPKYREFMPKNAKPSWGCCYIAAEALFHLWGKENGYVPVRVPYTLGPKTKGQHWFLRHWPCIEYYVDLTADQFTSMPPSRVPKYSEAIPCGFLTKKPSKRAQQIIDAVLGKK